MKQIDKIPVGVSACVVGQKVRFDGGHKQSGFVVRDLDPYFDYRPACPEMAAGMGTPRQTVRLVEDGDWLKVRGSRDRSFDVSDALHNASEKLSDGLADLRGYIFCAKSPSCGMERVKVYHPNGHSLRHDGVGVFAEKILKKYPYLPCEETGRLNDVLIRESFLTRVFTLDLWKRDVEANLTKKSLLDFHAKHKLMLMAHSPEHYRAIGPLLADLSSANLEQVAYSYIVQLMQGLAMPASRKKHTNVLMHIQGYFKRALEVGDKAELTQMIHRYREGLLPLSTPRELLKHYLRKHRDDYLQGQRYFQPYPEHLTVRTVF
ncbi:DUF1722 domain-containing protein [Corallincola luteus]|uniref:DUF1722 domain-containing protein n=1 Tax=Corallincola luteus TaxID=1775177 RepID=A0ABY2AHD1_9GAMM|nr:DUF523 and DUF1722 domain-containing protein [Corallincola luteus]TCI01807.1 DUF1722 domain-containing protein [Corallincola luteus]